MNGFHADGLTLKKVLDQKLKVIRKYIDYVWRINGGVFFVNSGISSLMKKKCQLQL